MTRCAIYARYSSDRQNERSADDQIHACRAYATRMGWAVTSAHKDEAKSGASLIGRDGFAAVMAAANSGQFDVLLVEAVDRIGRNQADFATVRQQLKFKGIQLYTTSDGEIGTINGSIRAMFAEWMLEDTAEKTRRGLAAVTRSGRHAGGKCYGYRPVARLPSETNKNGVLELVPEEVTIIQEIFDAVAAGRSPRFIAADLNRRGVPGPRGGQWNASTINGSRARANGILNNELYRGSLVSNRQSFQKNPLTGKRVSRPNSCDRWVHGDAPQLRIVTEEVWRAVQARQGSAGAGVPKTRNAKHVFSGLLRCGHCGGSYIVAGSDRSGGPRLSCSTRRERGTCDNRRTLYLSIVEQTVLRALKDRLLAPDAVAEFATRYIEHRNALLECQAQSRKSLLSQKASVDAKARNLLTLLEDGLAGRDVALRLKELEAKSSQLADELTAIPAAYVTADPSISERMRCDLNKLQKGGADIRDAEDRQTLFTRIRPLVDRIVIHPHVQNMAVDLEIHGKMATLFRTYAHSSLAHDEHAQMCVGQVVAGVGFEPTTFRL